MQFTFIHNSLKVFKDRINILEICYIIMAETKRTNKNFCRRYYFNLKGIPLQPFPHAIFFQTTLYCYYKEGRNPPTLNAIDMYTKLIQPGK